MATEPRADVPPPSAAPLLLTFLLVIGCGERGSGGDAPITDSTYVEVMARLVRIDSTFRARSELSMGRDSAREMVFRAYDVRPEELLAFADRIGPEVDRMHAIWDHIRVVADSLDRRGWTPDSLP